MTIPPLYSCWLHSILSFGIGCYIKMMSIITICATKADYYLHFICKPVFREGLHRTSIPPLDDLTPAAGFAAGLSWFEKEIKQTFKETSNE